MSESQSVSGPVSDSSAAAPEWVSVTEAAGVSQVSERTMWRWLTSGKVSGRTTEDGRREIRRDSLPRPAASVTGSVPVGHGGVTSGTASQSPSGAGDSQPAEVSDTGLPVSGPARDDSAALRKALENARGRLAELHERERQALQREATLREELATTRAAAAERDFLRERLVQSEAAERELRVLMLRQSEQIQALTASQEPRALPEKGEERPTETPAESPRRPWWRFGKR